MREENRSELPRLYTQLIANPTHSYSLLIYLFKTHQIKVNQNEYLNKGPEFDIFSKNILQVTEQRSEIRILLLGGRKSGKTQLLQRLVRESGLLTKKNVNFPIPGIQMYGYNDITFYIWDPPGRCKYYIFSYIYYPIMNSLAMGVISLSCLSKLFSLSIFLFLYFYCFL